MYCIFSSKIVCKKNISAEKHWVSRKKRLPPPPPRYHAGCFLLLFLLLLFLLRLFLLLLFIAPLATIAFYLLVLYIIHACLQKKMVKEDGKGGRRVAFLEEEGRITRSHITTQSAVVKPREPNKSETLKGAKKSTD